MKKPDIKTVLVPIDFSKLSGPAIEIAKDLARRFDASIHLVHVHEFYYSPGLLAPVPLSVMTYRDDAATRRARRLRMLAKKNGLAPENCHFMAGAPTFQEICKLAGQIGADLIVMPTHGYTGITRFFGGSTAERIVQHSPCPVLVRREARESSAAQRRGFDHILVPVDFSQPSFQALEYAIELAERMASRLTIFHAVPLADAFTADGFAMYDLSALEEAARRDAEDQMQRFVGLAKFCRVPFETVITVAPAVSEICAFAEKSNVDLIITATHGRTGLKHLLMGSVAENLVRHASRPVLVVPTHPEIRLASLTKIAPSNAGRQSAQGSPKPLPALSEATTKRGRKLLAHPAPERRRTNRFRESHSV
ncbi:MAG: universal stress protein [Chthoniobacterales bacterium]